MIPHVAHIVLALALVSAACAPREDAGAARTGDHPETRADTGFAGVQHRGGLVMGVDQYASTHRFDKTGDGGRVELQSDGDDPQAIATIREHMRDIAGRFAAGDFSPSATVHAQEVPGTRAMAERRALITYTPRDLPRGGELLIRTTDSVAIAAIHAFIDFQRSDHRAGGADTHRH